MATRSHISLSLLTPLLFSFSGLVLGQIPAGFFASLTAEQTQDLNSLIGPFVAEQVTAPPEVISAQELFWSYGRSPPVYPSPRANGTGDWAEAYQEAAALVAQMTNEEKENLTYGHTSTTNGCAGNSGGVPRLGFPGLCFNDAAAGIHATELVNAYASGISVGASWNKELALARARHLGAEAKHKGINALLGPTIGPLGRTVTSGRAWESFSVDPYLCGAMAYETVTGLQENVIATAKHFIVNEQETNRYPSLLGFGNASVSSNVDDKTMHELYLWPFQDAVRAGLGAVMCSYNRINNSYACQNSAAQNGLLKGELGYQGFIVSDWGAQHSGIASANAGLDVAMADSVYWAGNLTKGVANGTLSQSRLDIMATRIVATWYKLAQFEPGTGVPADNLKPHKSISALSPSSKSTIFQGGVEGHVLVKNVNNTLPLKSPKILSLYGYDARAPSTNNPGTLFVSKWALGYQSVNISDIGGLSFFLGGATGYDAVYNGTLIGGGGSGAISPPYINAPYDAFQERAYKDNTALFWDFESQDPLYQAGSDACIVFINSFATEGFDRSGLADDWSDKLVLNVAEKCPNTIVVIHNAGVRLVDAWIEHPNVTAVIFAHLPGQDSGRALVDIVYGEQSPSGRLPYTVAKREEDYGSLLWPVKPDNSSNYYTQANFTEGVNIDYRSFLARNVTPRYEFGYGLTYTNFTYSSLSTSLTPRGMNATLLPPRAPILEGGIASLWDTIAEVTVDIRNTGNFAAAEVPQLYVTFDGRSTAMERPVKQLRGFEKVPLDVGESETVRFKLTRRDLSVWDAGKQSWVLQSGSYTVYVGASVSDIRLVGKLRL